MGTMRTLQLCITAPSPFLLPPPQYDPYVPGSDFVRGYPFSMREGKPTAVSHGGRQWAAWARADGSCKLAPMRACGRWLPRRSGHLATGVPAAANLRVDRHAE